MKPLHIRMTDGGRRPSSQILIELLLRPANGESTDYAEMAVVVPLIRKLERVALDRDGDHATVAITSLEVDQLLVRMVGSGARFATNSPELYDIIGDVLAVSESRS